MMRIQKGDIYSAKLGADGKSDIIYGVRPVIVINAELNSTLVHVVPLTTGAKRRVNERHIRIEGHGLDRPSIALIEQVRLIDKAELKNFIGTISGTAELIKVLEGVCGYFAPEAA